MHKINYFYFHTVKKLISDIGFQPSPQHQHLLSGVQYLQHFSMCSRLLSFVCGIYALQWLVNVVIKTLYKGCLSVSINGAVVPHLHPVLKVVSRRQRSSSFSQPTRSHAHRCSCLTRQHGGEWSSLVTLTFWPSKLCPSHVWRGLRLCQFGLPRPLCSRLRPDVRDRQTDVRQKHHLMPPHIWGEGIIMVIS